MDKDNPAFPIERKDSPERIRVAVRLGEAENERLEMVVRIWNEMNKALGRVKGRRWTATSVVERFVTLELDAFFTRYGGFPSSPEQEADITRRAVAEIKKLAGKK